MKTICLTFDDGLQSHYDVALTLLKKHKLKGTFFITGQTELWNYQIVALQKGMQEPAMDFSKLHEFEEAGMSLCFSCKVTRDSRVRGGSLKQV